MTDRIEPALTPQQWAKYAKTDADPILRQRRRDFNGDHLAWLIASPDRAPSLIALANAALPDDDPRKITRYLLQRVRQLMGVHEDEEIAFLDALESYLPPE